MYYLHGVVAAGEPECAQSGAGALHEDTQRCGQASQQLTSNQPQLLAQQQQHRVQRARYVARAPGVVAVFAVMCCSETCITTTEWFTYTHVLLLGSTHHTEMHSPAILGTSGSLKSVSHSRASTVTYGKHVTSSSAGDSFIAVLDMMGFEDLQVRDFMMLTVAVWLLPRT